MNRSSLFRPIAFALAGVAIASGLVAASAATASAAEIGTLTFTGLSSQTTGFDLTTSAGCPTSPTNATNFLVKIENDVTVSGNTANLPNPILSPNLNGNTSGGTIGGGINAGPFTATAQTTLQQFAQDNGISNLGNGTYVVTLVCRTALASASLGDFVGRFVVSGGGSTVTPVVPASPDATTTALAPSTLNPSWGAPVNMVVTVANTDTPATKPTGTVDIKEGASVLGTGTLVNGAVTIPIASLGLGAHTVNAVYAPSDSDLFQTSTSNDSSLTVALGIPTLLRAATLSGSIKVGGTAVCNTGTWSGAGSYKYEFLKNGVVAQTSTTDFDLALSAADAGKTLACRVTGVNPVGNSASASTTAGVKVALGSAAVAAKAPKITYSGSAANVGETLKAYRGVWSPTATYTYNYIWKRGSTVIKKGSTATSYKATAKDKGKKLTLTVQVKRTGYTTATKTSAAVTVK
jgi:hypothetical protein